jgi:uncharacterized membrane protein YeiH
MEQRLIQPVLDHVGVFVAAITGVLAARGKRVDLFGILVLALVTSLGGGTLRDILVGDNAPVFWLRSPWLLLNATITALLTFLIARQREMPMRVLLIADAFTLAAFTMIGTQKGLTMQFTAPVAVLLGVVTGVAGGILRDVLTGEVPMVFRPEIRLYATAALVGAAFCVALRAVGASLTTASIAGAASVLGLRLAGIYWKISLPIFETKKES